MASELGVSGIRVQAGSGISYLELTCRFFIIYSTGSVDVSIQIKLGILDFIRLTVLEVLFGHIH
jgi:hypothetical protein